MYGGGEERRGEEEEDTMEEEEEKGRGSLLYRGKQNHNNHLRDHNDSRPLRNNITSCQFCWNNV